MSNEERRTSLVLLTGAAVAATAFLLLTGCSGVGDALANADAQYIGFIRDQVTGGRMTQDQADQLLAAWANLKQSVADNARGWVSVVLEYLGVFAAGFLGLKGGQGMIASLRKPPAATAAA